MKKICSRCKIEKDVGEFYRSKKYEDGHNLYCKKCVNESSQRYYKRLLSGECKRKEVKKQVCYMCKEEKKIEEFGKDKYSATEYTYDCRECRNKRKKEYRGLESSKRVRRNRENKRRGHKIIQYRSNELT